jgi:hypothetical protein
MEIRKGQPQIAQISRIREGRHRFSGIKFSVPDELARGPSAKSLASVICEICGSLLIFFCRAQTMCRMRST